MPEDDDNGLKCRPESAGLKGGGEESRLLSEGWICEVSEYVRPVPLGNDNGRKCRPVVPRSTVGQR